MPTSVRSANSENRKRTAGSSDGEGSDRIIDGLRYPRPERQIDQFGFELTTHRLHFHGRDWDIPLTRKRDELTKAFLLDAAAAANEPDNNIRNLRFIVTPTHLDAKMMVRHKAHVSKYEVQKMLSTAKWSHVKALYEPRKKMRRPNRLAVAGNRNGGAQDDQPMLGANRRTASHNLSFFGRANVGAEGPEFEDHADADEEPVAYEHQQDAKERRTTSHLFISVGLAA
ncbi:hypothetical protein LSCM1_04212 [Leishmania martiniquensis]|uniref:Flagellar attachment zone protein 1 conserved domain-containing protein n=1 Tax=Leishmania martiniquensis TaxID=1580590 RepID=A0A836HGP3_9TRYP|nr:hypothetical protein LSCM1_04212 [Leishmania martiniquensis]